MSKKKKFKAGDKCWLSYAVFGILAEEVEFVEEMGGYINVVVGNKILSYHPSLIHGNKQSALKASLKYLQDRIEIEKYNIKKCNRYIENYKKQINTIEKEFKNG